MNGSSASGSAIHRLGAFAGVVLTVASCHRRETPQPPASPPHYVVGAPWQGAGGAWFYPKEQLDFHETGLAVVQTAHPSRLTLDGEAYDPQAMAAAHQTLQLPCVIQVTNLDSGRRILVRVNDRGPAEQGRILALTPAAASLLQMRPDQPARILIELDAGRSHALSEQVAGGPHLDIDAAPVEAVEEQSLAPPDPAGHGEAGRSVRGQIWPSGPSGEPTDNHAGRTGALAAGPELGRVTQGLAAPGALWIDAGQFSRRDYAQQIAAGIGIDGLGGIVRTEGQGRQTVYLVREGPFQRASDADAALDQARRAGVTGARIIVE